MRLATGYSDHTVHYMRVAHQYHTNPTIHMPCAERRMKSGAGHHTMTMSTKRKRVVPDVGGDVGLLRGQAPVVMTNLPLELERLRPYDRILPGV